MADLWSWVNYVDDALLSSVTGSAGDLVVGNLHDERTAKVWRAGSMPAELRMAFATNVTAAVFGVFGVNFRDLGVVTLRLGTTPGSGNLWQEVLDPDDITLDRQAVFVLGTPVTAAHATVLAQGGVGLEIGRVWVGSADWTPLRTHAFDGSRWTLDDLSSRSRTPRSGSFLIDKGARLRSATVNYTAVDVTEFNTLFDMSLGGISRQMLFVPTEGSYDAHRFAVLGYLGEAPTTDWRTLLTAQRFMTILEAG